MVNDYFQKALPFKIKTHQFYTIKTDDHKSEEGVLMGISRWLKVLGDIKYHALEDPWKGGGG